jgi:hypothetical protein
MRAMLTDDAEYKLPTTSAPKRLLTADHCSEKVVPVPF